MSIRQIDSFGKSLDDILIVPRYFPFESRKDVDTSVQFGPYKLRVPILSSCMDTITEDETAIAMWNAGGLGVLHRFCSPLEQAIKMSTVKDSGANAAIAVGLKHYRENIDRCEPEIVVIDVAHAHTLKTIETIRKIKKHYPSIFLVAGNIATSSAALDLIQAGADCLRVGIGGGSNCSTRIITGCGSPQATTIMEIYNSISNLTKIQIIADGGIKSSGDIAKSLACGADLVMIGNLLAGSKEAPGLIFEDGNGRRYKLYRGMASADVGIQKLAQSRSGMAPEGISRLVECKGTIKNIIESLTNGLRSAMSYAGCLTLEDFHSTTLMEITSASIQEGKPYGIN